MIRRFNVPLIIFISCLIAAAALAYFILKSEKEMPISRPDEKLPEEQIHVSAWVTEWNGGKVEQEALQLMDRLESIQLFGLYFDENDRLYETEKFTAMQAVFQEAKKNADKNEVSNDKISDTMLYGSIINDSLTIGSGKPPVQKNSELISRLVKSPQSRKEHIHDIVQKTLAYNWDGIEIDYEKITDKDWGNFTEFVKELYREMHQRGKEVRIVLEPNAPIEKIDLPEGPEYVVMAYNLYGTHSGAGPKANISLIRKLAGKMDYLPGTPVLALATGGFDWHEDGSIKSLTEQQAAAIQMQYKKEAGRDKQSGAMTFDYQDENGKQHEIWYADSETLALWIETASRAGRNSIAIWRLGEMEKSTLDYLRQL